MTIEEKRNYIKEYCNNHSCAVCPLYNIKRNYCYSELLSDEEIERNYNIIVSSNNNEDPVNRPSHYTDGKIEVIDFIEDKKLGFCLGNAIKYIARAGKKDPTKEVEDLKKAKWYIERRIKELEE